MIKIKNFNKLINDQTIIGLIEMNCIIILVNLVIDILVIEYNNIIYQDVLSRDIDT